MSRLKSIMTLDSIMTCEKSCEKTLEATWKTTGTGCIYSLCNLCDIIIQVPSINFSKQLDRWLEKEASRSIEMNINSSSFPQPPLGFSYKKNSPKGVRFSGSWRRHLWGRCTRYQAWPTWMSGWKLGSMVRIKGLFHRSF